MSLTNFANLTAFQLTVWSRDFWAEARNKSFFMSFAGSGPNSMLQRITELRQTNDGARAVITLLSDLQGDGVVGDNTLEGNEEAGQSHDQIVTLDQLRHAERATGKMAEQRSVVRFRGQAKDKLTYWMSDRLDQVAILTASGVSYAFNTDGSPRVGSQLPQLAFASQVTAPTANRFFRWNAAGTTLLPGDTTQITAADTPSWAMIVELKAKAVSAYMRPLRTAEGIESWNLFMTPMGIAKLKQDEDFIQAWRYAEKRGDDNPIFKGTPLGGKIGIYIDGINILEYRRIFNTTGAVSGSKWGAGGTIDGQRCLLMGAQALAVADIGMATWDEKYFDYGNSPGIAVGKIFGLLKPQFFSIYSQSVEDFSIMVCDTAI
jgi:N4-gp56 family major capsid protein